MIPMIPTPGLSVRQKSAALWVASIVDFIQLPGFAVFVEGFLSPVEYLLDIFTAIVLLAICGFRWQFVLAFAVELVPGLSLFPTWTMVVLTLRTNLQEPQGLARVSRAGPGAGRQVVDVEAVVVPPVQASSDVK